MKFRPLFFLLVLAVPARAQQNDAFYLMDANWKPTKMDSAKFFYRVRKINDTCWQWDSYNLMGPLIRSERYRDKDANVQEGTSYYYSPSGRLDSLMPFRDNKRNGECLKYSPDSLRVLCKYVYRNDSLVGFVDYSNDKPDTTTHPGDKESEYPGGVAKWLRYLNKNLRYPDRALNSKIDGEVRVLFVVDKEGGVGSPVVYLSVEWSLDDEAVRIITQSGKWTPAFRDGGIAKSYKCQPIIYRLQ